MRSSLMDTTLDTLAMVEHYVSWRSSIQSSSDDPAIWTAHITRGDPEGEYVEVLFSGSSLAMDGAINNAVTAALSYLRERLAIADGASISEIAAEARAYAAACVEDDDDEEEDEAA